MSQNDDLNHALCVSVMVCLLGALAGQGCATDMDAQRQHALGVPLLLTVQDQLNASRGDQIDWKRFTAMETADASLVVRVGDPFAGGHNLQGAVTVFTEDAETAASTPITPNQMKLILNWRASENTLYYLKVEASSGAAPYKLELTYRPVAPEDPCATDSCDDDEVCVGGKCISTNRCDPPCERDESCVDGECISDHNAEPACGGPCPRGQRCNKRKNRCVRDPCHNKRCPKGQVCRAGTCRARVVVGGSTTTRKTNTCEPACGAGESCVKGQCKLGNISAKVVQSVARSGDRTTITLSRGTSHKVSQGMKGKVLGVGSFSITSCTPYRCTAVLNAPISKLGAKNRATIYR